MSCLSALVRLSRQTEHTHCTEGHDRWVPPWAIVDHQPAAPAGKESAARVICTEPSARRPHTSPPPRPSSPEGPGLDSHRSHRSHCLPLRPAEPPKKKKKNTRSSTSRQTNPAPHFSARRPGRSGGQSSHDATGAGKVRALGDEQRGPRLSPGARTNVRGARLFWSKEKSALSDWGFSSFFQARLPFGRRSFLGLARDIHEVVEPAMEGSCEMCRGNNHEDEVHNSPIVGQQNSPSATRFFFSQLMSLCFITRDSIFDGRETLLLFGKPGAGSRIPSQDREAVELVSAPACRTKYSRCMYNVAGRWEGAWAGRRRLGTCVHKHCTNLPPSPSPSIYTYTQICMYLQCVLLLTR